MSNGCDINSFGFGPGGRTKAGEEDPKKTYTIFFNVYAEGIEIKFDSMQDTNFQFKSLLPLSYLYGRGVRMMGWLGRR